MMRCFKTLLIWCLGCSVASGCAARGIAGSGHPPLPAQASPTPGACVGDPPARVTAAATLPGEWGPYFGPRLLDDLEGDNATGQREHIARGYVFHRLDVEKIRVLGVRAERLTADLSACETRVAELAAPSFWHRTEGQVLLLAVGFAAGTATTVGIAVAIGRR